MEVVIPYVVTIGCTEAGKGAAVLRTMCTSSARFVGFGDSDLSPPVSGAHATQCGFMFFNRRVVAGALARCQTVGFAVESGRG
ncbi:hypothetical protein HUT19_40155 [Streptomyces sp. NA02950]|uniref:hypothetical protein n=1 Tax=Streptomyces sp. NA02950 TaxID=2742137 RepID=UPI001591002E|nr:hypothetical protein [Streptomyces sp. NA02950]QKV97132.1 hypothetical protein HUT19_40155 [Streptomyces sp. NA02950]